jgi:hypothetical protein
MEAFDNSGLFDAAVRETTTRRRHDDGDGRETSDGSAML